MERRNCLEKPRKPMIPLKYLDILFRRRYLPNTQFYFTNRRHALTPDELEAAKTFKHVSPFTLPKSQNILSYIKYRDRKEKLITHERYAQPLHLKDNLRMAATRDLSKRMFLHEPPDDIRTVLEIHPEFYSVIEGRPIRCFDDIKVYMNNIRNFAMNRQQLGYRRDLILKINRTMTQENTQCEVLTEQLKHHVKNFQKFLTEDYKQAMAKVAKAEKLYEDLVAKNIEFLSYVNEITTLNNTIFTWDSIRNVLKVYRKYLIFAAPIPWRQQYDETLRDRVQSLQFEVGSFVAPDETDLIETLDIDRIVELAKIELQNPLPAHMYFTEPSQMLYMFRTMEIQSREYLLQLSLSSAPHRMLRDRIKQIKASTKFELDYFQYYIDTINYEIAREEHNEKHLQTKFFRILDVNFWDSVASPSTLKLKICIEYVYEQIFGKCEEGHASLMDPMKILEVFYEEYNIRIDALDFLVVEEARRELYAQDLVVLKNAKNAQRQLKGFREMTAAMDKAFMPPAKFKRPVFKKFMSKQAMMELARVEKQKAKLARGERVRAKAYKVTNDEREALTFFTDWCDGANPAPYLKDYRTYVEPVLMMAPPESNPFA